MSNPRPESRIKSLESRATDIEASIEELASDNAESLRSIRQDINALSDKVDQGFLQAHTYIQENIETVLTDHTQRLDRLESKLDQILQLLQQKNV